MGIAQYEKCKDITKVFQVEDTIFNEKLQIMKFWDQVKLLLSLPMILLTLPNVRNQFSIFSF